MWLRLYRRLRKLNLSKEALQSGLLMGAGDIIAQTVVEKKKLKQIDQLRTQRFFWIGTIFVGPPLRVWYKILHKFFGDQNKAAAAKKVAVDQIVFAPVFMGIILSIINFSQSFSIKEVKRKLKQDYPDILVNNYKIWPAVQLCNFYYIPLKYQVLTVQVVAVFWNTYISWKTNKAEDKVK